MKSFWCASKAGEFHAGNVQTLLGVLAYLPQLLSLKESGKESQSGSILLPSLGGAVQCARCEARIVRFVGAKHELKQLCPLISIDYCGGDFVCARNGFGIGGS